MAIYNINGTQLNDAYDITDSIDTAYDINGNVVFSAREPDYSNYSYTQKWASKDISSTQGFDIYDDKVFWVKKSGNASVDNAMYIFNLSDGSYALGSGTPFITAYGGHGNNVTFSDQFYSEYDDYPLVLMSTAYANPAYINRISNSYVATLITEIAIPVIDGVTNADFDICYGETNDIAYTASVFGSNSDASLGTHICIAKWDMSNLVDNGDGTFSPTFISSVQCDWHYWKQGIKYHDGLIWLASGYPNFRAYVYGINPETGETIYTIDCETTIEIEGAVWYPDAEAIGGYALYVGFQGMMLRKYIFSAK